MRVAGVDACRSGWVAVSLDAASVPVAAGALPVPVAVGALPVAVGAGALPVAVRVGASLAALLAPWLEHYDAMTVGIDMPLGLLETGWREADRAARRLLGAAAQLGVRDPALCGVGAGELSAGEPALP